MSRPPQVLTYQDMVLELTQPPYPVCTKDPPGRGKNGLDRAQERVLGVQECSYPLSGN